MLKLQIIVGSTREGRNADLVLPWVKAACEAQKGFEVEVLDLRDWALPMFQETIATVGDFANPTYSDMIVKRWNDKIGEGDAYLIVTPEYNRSVPAVLKNAIDSVFFSFRLRHKAVAFVGYSLGPTAGARAVEHLTQIMVETEAIPVRTPTLISSVTTAFGPDGQATNPVSAVNMTVMLEDLEWLAKALKSARSEGQLIPSALRIRPAMGRR